MINPTVHDDYKTKMAILVEKLSGKGWSWNKRVIY